MDLGEEIKRVRAKSSYPMRSTFSKEVGISSEALRKIEIGKSIPTKNTLEVIIDTGNPPDAIKKKLRRARDEAQAKRDNLHLPQTTKERDVEGLTSNLVDVVEGKLSVFFRDDDGVPFSFTDEERGTLREAILNTLKGSGP